MSEKDYSKIIELERLYHSRLFPKKDFVTIKGSGALIYDEKGNEYIDCVAGHGVMNIGYSHPKYIEAVKNQLEKLVMISPGYPVEERAKLLKKLAEITPKPLTKSFLSNSGTEAIEAAIKLVLVSNRAKKKTEIIAFKRAFHGRSLGSLAMTFNKKYREAFMSWLSPNVKYASFGNIDSVKELINENTGAIFTELIQGEGGVHPFKDDFPQQLRELCDEKDILLIDDEVQTGFGRTGKMFACEHYGIVPDVICMAKGIAGGIPMGATITTKELDDNFNIGEHNTTFGGNPLACAAANATIDILLNENLVENAANQGEKIMSEFRKLSMENDNVKGVRGKGLMIGVDFRKPVRGRINKAVSKGVLFLNAGLTVIRMLPPLVLSDSQTEKVIKVMREISQ